MRANPPARTRELAMGVLLLGGAAVTWARWHDPVEAALAAEDPALRRAAALALGERGVRAAWAVPHLLPLLADDATAATAAFALGEIGPAAAAAIPHLIACAARADPVVRARAGFALARIAPHDPRAQVALAALRARAEPIVRKLASPVR